MIKDGHRISECFSRKINLKEMKQTKKTTKREVTLDGLLTVGMLETGLHAEFMCCEDVVLESVVTRCKVQVMRDGNMYLTELPKRVKNKPMLREDNSSLTLGRDGKYYFRFVLGEELADALPELLCREAWLISRKFINERLCAGKEVEE